MSTSTHTRRAAEAPPPPPGRPVPGMALRTYRFLRFSVLAVIAALTTSLVIEIAETGCVQGSISAYYFTDARSFFVGALVAIGLVMIVLWGKSPAEDGWLNLAGMLAPVVAFVPTTETADTRKCALETSSGATVTSDRQEVAIVETAGRSAIDNNMLAYLVVIGLVLLAVLVRGLLAHRRTHEALVVDHPYAYWLPFGAASALWLFGVALFLEDGRTWLYDHAHMWSAILLFVCVVAAVIAIGFQKRNGERGGPPSRGWARFYWWLAAAMTLGAGLVVLLSRAVFPDHVILLLEAWMILGLAVFWVAQTVDRWHDGAPTPADAEAGTAGT